MRKGADAKSHTTKIFCLKDDEKGSFQETFIFNDENVLPWGKYHEISPDYDADI